MKIKDLIKEIKSCQKKYGKEFLEWDVYTEQITPEERKTKTKGFTWINGPNGKKQKWSQADWGKIKDSEGWEYFKCAGFWTKFPDEKIFTINVNY